MSQKILYDHQTFQIQRFGGISRYFVELMKHTAYPYELSLRFSDNIYLKDIRLKERIAVPSKLFKIFLKQFSIYNEKYSLSRLKQHKGVFHPTYYSTYFFKEPFRGKLVITVHDMIHERFPEYFAKNDATSLQKKQLVEKADCIIAISEHTKNDLMELYKVDASRIAVIYHGIDSENLPKLPFNDGFPTNYLLYVGDRTKYKNFNCFLDAFQALADNDDSLHLVCTGKPFKRSELALFKSMQLENKIHHKQSSDFELRQLFAQAKAFVYPSLYEGFGIPILEAFRENCPAVLSKASCFPEVASDAAAYFDANSSEEMAAVIWDVISDDALRKTLIAKGKERVKLFTWEQTAKATDALYKQL